MKKVVFYLIAILSIISFTISVTSCGPEEPQDDKTPPDVQQTPDVQDPVTTPSPTPDEIPAGSPGNGDDQQVTVDEVFSLLYKDFLIEMNQDINDVVDALGDPLGIFEAPSCAFDGIDRIFSYPGLQIHTYPSGDDDFIHTISFRDDSIGTSENIYLGDSLDLLLKAYGEDFEYELDMYTFTRGLTTLSFLIEEDMVVSITYGFVI